jgi:hypothetical protein
MPPFLVDLVYHIWQMTKNWKSRFV